MFTSFAMRNTLVALVMAFAAATGCSAAARAPIPPPASDSPLAQSQGKADGCFVTVVASGGPNRCLSGLKASSLPQRGIQVKPHPPQPTTRWVEEDPGHAESVKVVFDPSKITYGQLLRIFFTVAHDPTQLNRQGPDVGALDRSVIFYSSDERRKLGRHLHRTTGRGQNLSQTDRDRSCSPEGLIMMRESRYHPGLRTAQSEQSFLVARMVCDRPKIKALKQQFPEYFKDYHGE